MGYISPWGHPKPVNLDEELKKQGLTDDQIKKLWNNVEKEIERKEKHWF